MLPYVLAYSRFEHYFKAIARDTFSASMLIEDREQKLRSWTDNYVCHDHEATRGLECRYALSSAHVSVEADRHRPGRYLAVARLRPNYQLEELPVMPRLIVELPEPLSRGSAGLKETTDGFRDLDMKPVRKTAHGTARRSGSRAFKIEGPAARL